MQEESGEHGSIRIQCAGRSDVGRVRARNEDVVGIDSLYRWVVLADGMGGYRGGDIAARISVDAVRSRLEQEYRHAWSADEARHALIAGARDANRDVFRASQDTPGLTGMGSTLVAVVFLDRQLVCAHVGDSRFYRKREDVLALLTRDHTVLQEQLDDGMIDMEDARVVAMKSMLTRGIGVSYALTPDIGLHDAHPGDLYLLCSDGLTDMLDDDEIAALLENNDPVESIADRLVERANQRGGRDNISVVVVRLAE